jgi:2-polyprenyl-6-methoxyphenol hydroxylase-like FAD-dependent oxidoreductase
VHTTDVLIVGAGPTGLMLAGELAMAGVSCRLLERRVEEPNITRAFAVHARTLELLDARGMADDLLPHGFPVPAVTPTPGSTLDLHELDTRYPMILITPQSGTERALLARALDLDVEIVRGAEVADIKQDADGVTVELADGGLERARYLVGCDGAHSAVRRLIGVDFTGKQYETHILLADVQLTNPPDDPMFARNNGDGAVIVVPFGDGWYRAIAWDRLREQAPLSEPVTLAEMQDAFRRIAGDHYGMSGPRWSTRFLSERRQAERYRVGRVFLAGDAAHVHSPLGGQGMNTGIQDAMNLGWKLAATVQGSGAPWLLDSYESERHPVGEKVLALTDAFNRLVLGRSPVRRAMQRLAIRVIIHFGRTRRMMAGRLTGVGIAYPGTKGDHPMTGKRMPDVDCSGVRLYELLRQGRFVLLTTDGADVGDRSGIVSAIHSSPTVPAAVLVRPDGYVAWAADSTAQLSAALDHWCGQAQPSVR